MIYTQDILTVLASVMFPRITTCLPSAQEPALSACVGCPSMLHSARPLFHRIALVQRIVHSKPTAATSLHLRAMSTAPTRISGQSFRLAMIQLAAVGDGSDKAANLAHAKEMIAKAVQGGQEGRKPDVVVLPVRLTSPTCQSRPLVVAR